jgi:hypothetical protein
MDPALGEQAVQTGSKLLGRGSVGGRETLADLGRRQPESMTAQHLQDQLVKLLEIE